jgi:hypothetical protein
MIAGEHEVAARFEALAGRKGRHTSADSPSVLMTDPSDEFNLICLFMRRSKATTRSRPATPMRKSRNWRVTGPKGVAGKCRFGEIFAGMRDQRKRLVLIVHASSRSTSIVIIKTGSLSSRLSQILIIISFLVNRIVRISSV